MPRSRLPRGFDLTDASALVHGQPHEEFADLRRTAPVTWVSQPRGSSGFDDEGYWAVTKHADVMAISRDTQTWSSWENTALVRYRPSITRPEIDMQRAVMLNMDPPYHTQIRAVVARGFTPRAIGALRSALHERAEKIVREARLKGEGDFVVDIASELPLQAISELIGVSQEDRGKIFDWSNKMVYENPDEPDVPVLAAMEVLAYAMQMAEERKVSPRDDIASKLVAAQNEGNLTTDEFGYFIIMLAVAGNETTRNAITHGMRAFLDNPEQWELFKAERPKTFVDEVIRWATPVNAFQRTATRDVEFHGNSIKQGDRVCLFYGSANFDEEIFERPYEFDILRSPNPHLGFGGSGAHYCLGASLARLEIELIFNEIADQLPDIHQTGPVERVVSGWVHGIQALPVRYGKPTPPDAGGDEDSQQAAVPRQRKQSARKAAKAPTAKAAAAKAAPAKAPAAKAAAGKAAAGKSAAGKSAPKATKSSKVTETPAIPPQKAAKAPARRPGKKANPAAG